MMRSRRRRYGAQAGRVIPVVIFFAAWQGASMLRLIDPEFLPSVASVLAALMALIRSGEIEWNLAVTLATAFGGLGAAILVGVPVGAAMAIFKSAEGFFGPLVKASYSLPKSALVPLFILWFGVGAGTNGFTVALASLLPIVIYTYHGVQSVPSVLVWSALSMGTGRREIIWRVLLPGAAHAILTGIRIALGFSFVLAISAEMIAANSGVGKLVYTYGENGAYDYMFAAVAAIVVVAYLADRGLVVLSDYLLRWHEPMQTQA